MAKTIEILHHAWRLVLDNLALVLSMRREVLWKEDGSPVTKADIFLEELISKYLSQHFDNLAIVAEESYSFPTHPYSDWVAVIDPIDGTENFCSGLKEWGIAISIWRGGKHEGSCLMMPELGDVLISGDQIPTFRSRIVGVSSSYHPEIGRVIASYGESRIMGCSVYNMYNVIRGSFTRFYNPKGAYCWDIQAGVLLALDAGCEVLVNEERYHGQFLEPGQRYRVDVRH